MIEIKKYTNVQIEVEAIQFVTNDRNWAKEVAEWCKGEFCYYVMEPSDTTKWFIAMMQSKYLSAKQGDWIIKGTNGEFMVCKSDTFVRNYKELSVESDLSDNYKEATNILGEWSEFWDDPYDLKIGPDWLLTRTRDFLNKYTKVTEFTKEELTDKLALLEEEFRNAREVRSIEEIKEDIQNVKFLLGDELEE